MKGNVSMKRIAFALGLLFLIWLVLEMLLRVVFFDSPALRYDGYTLEDPAPQGVYALGAGTPHSKVTQYVNIHNYINKSWYPRSIAEHPFLWRYLDQDLQYVITYNNCGYRNAFDIQIPKPKESFRILVLGDSFAFGDVLSDFDTLPFWMNYFLNLRSDSNAFYEVLNGGIPGTTINVQREMFLKRGLQSQPNQVVLVVCGNDVAEMDEMYQKAMPQMSNDAPLSVRRFHALRQFLKRSVVVRALNLFRQRVRQSRQRQSSQEALQAFQEFIEKPLDRAVLREKYLRELALFMDDLEQERIPLSVVMYGGAEDVDSRTAIKRLCENREAPFLDMNDVFLSYASEASIPEIMYLIPYNYHPSRYGNYLTARHLLELLNLPHTRSQETSSPTGAQTAP